MLALRTGAAIVPIGINDSDRVWPRGSKIPLPIPRRTVTVRVGEPFRLADVVPAGTRPPVGQGHRDRPRSWAGSPRSSIPGSAACTRTPCPANAADPERVGAKT